MRLVVTMVTCALFCAFCLSRAGGIKETPGKKLSQILTRLQQLLRVRSTDQRESNVGDVKVQGYGKGHVKGEWKVKQEKIAKARKGTGKEEEGNDKKKGWKSLEPWESFLKDTDLSGCVGIPRIINRTGSLITSPGYPHVYDNNLDCVYNITAPPGMIIQLLFDFLDVESSRTCVWDHLEVYDSPILNSGYVGSYCGHSLSEPTAPGRILSSHNVLLLRFVTDISVVYRGFSARVRFLSPGEVPDWPVIDKVPSCGPINVTDGDVITSPGYPKLYQSYTRCEWKVSVPDGYAQLAFDSFDVEYCGDTCDCDRLSVFPSFASPAPLAVLCGDRVPSPVTSPTREMKVVMETDFSVTDRGFRARVKKASHFPWTLPELPGRGFCGGVYTNPVGVVHSQNYEYGGKYNNNSQCEWHIISSYGFIRLNFSSFDVEWCGDSCFCDRLMVYDGVNATSPFLVLCGHEVPQYIVASGPTLKLRFVTDDTETDRGFAAFWDITDIQPPAHETPEHCGGILVNDTGSIQSPGKTFGRHYSDNEFCEWHITLPHSESIIITFTSFEVQSCFDCSCDVVEIYSGLDGTVPQHLLCGNSLPLPVVVPTSSFSIIFASDGSETRPGFVLNWQPYNDSCGASLVEPGQNFSTWGYEVGLHYRNNMQCEWTIMVPDSDPYQPQYVQLLISEMDIEECGEHCLCDRIEVFESPLSLLAEHVFCGRTSEPQTFTSTGDYLRLRFVTDYSVTGAGFLASWQVTDQPPDPSEHDHDLCTNTFLQPSGYLRSPQYDDGTDYGNNVECAWYIEVPEMTAGQRLYVTLRFLTFGLEECGIECGCDKVELYERISDNVPFVTLCGSIHQIPAQITSNTNALKIRFSTDGSVTDMGFEAVWNVTTVAPPPGPPERPQCYFEHLAENGGEITSPSFERGYYPASVDCEYVITAPSGRYIWLEFTEFDLEDCYECGCDWLEIISASGWGSQSESLVTVSDDLVWSANMTYCGEDGPGMLILQAPVIIKFITDSSIQHAGFVAVYGLAP